MSMMTDAADAERQRFVHLVLGRARPAPTRVGRGRSKQRTAVRLAPEIEQQVAMRERWSHKAGTPETHEHAAKGGQSTLERLRTSGAITGAQYDAGDAIRMIADRIGADVSVRTASLETRIDGGDCAHGAFFEQLGTVWREVAYTRWRARLKTPAPVLAIIVEDIGLAEAAKRFRMGPARAKALLIAALDDWTAAWRDACRDIDEQDLERVKARLG